MRFRRCAGRLRWVSRDRDSFVPMQSSRRLGIPRLCVRKSTLALWLQAAWSQLDRHSQNGMFHCRNSGSLSPEPPRLLLDDLPLEHQDFVLLRGGVPTRVGKTGERQGTLPLMFGEQTPHQSEMSLTMCGPPCNEADGRQESRQHGGQSFTHANRR